ncbi:GT2 family glycosyltransferase [Tamaricihabitans halophyticus]|uniref:GT2 family glycosyltransferase n=1 Tax=Tamaricihabitans halophyticus TaxID=1262583 RepID=A0A4R2RBU0_9PSEU|nr:glycosyltransferase family 2 protein [Tamaricihabitans halophyticus]TCP57191.1 GT2 family glycosyltransferase [Tamaricihabitans halophyticus]
MTACTVSFVLVTHGRGELAASCLAIVAKHTKVAYEVIVVDSASPDGSGEWLANNLSDATVLRMGSNLGFGAGCELGIQRAKGEFICLLNADVEVTPGWLEPLLALLRANPRAAAVAPAMAFPDGRLQEAGSMIGGDGFSRGWGDGERSAEALYPRVVDYASAACLLLRRSAFYAVGGFCADYHIAYYEDADLQFTLRERGWQVWLQPASRVVHVRHGTSSTSTAERLSAINRKVFRRRWADDLARRTPAVGAPKYPHRLHWLRDAAAPYSVLLLAERAPRDGRLHAAISAWRAAEPAAAVTLLAVDGAGAAALRGSGTEVVSHVDDVESWGKERAGCYDVVVTFGAKAYDQLALAANRQPTAARVFDVDDLAHEELERRFAECEEPKRRREIGAQAGMLRRRGVQALREADVVICASETEAGWAREIVGSVPLYTANARAYPDVLNSVLVDCALPPARAT